MLKYMPAATQTKPAIHPKVILICCVAVLLPFQQFALLLGKVKLAHTNETPLWYLHAVVNGNVMVEAKQKCTLLHMYLASCT